MREFIEMVRRQREIQLFARRESVMLALEAEEFDCDHMRAEARQLMSETTATAGTIVVEGVNKRTA